MRYTVIGIILDMGLANERRRYNVTSSLIGWTHIQNDPCVILSIGDFDIMYHQFLIVIYSVSHGCFLLVQYFKAEVHISLCCLEYCWGKPISVKRHCFFLLVIRINLRVGQCSDDPTNPCWWPNIIIGSRERFKLDFILIIFKLNFQANFGNRWINFLLWNWSPDLIDYKLTLVQVPSRSKALLGPILIQFCVAIWCH